MVRPARGGAEDGETLVEILIAIVILAIASMGLIAGITNGVFASDSHRRLSTGESVMRSYSELVKNKVLRPAATTVSSDVPAFAAGDSRTVPVVSTAAFTDALPFKASVDGIVMDVTTKTGTSFTGVLRGSGVIAKDAIVERYEPCPTPAFWAGVTASNPDLTGADRIKTPTVTKVTFFDALDQEIADCSGYHDPWDGMPASTPAPPNAPTSCWRAGTWLAVCDPAWMRVTLLVESTETNKTTLTSDMIIRRPS